MLTAGGGGVSGLSCSELLRDPHPPRPAARAAPGAVNAGREQLGDVTTLGGINTRGGLLTLWGIGTNCETTAPTFGQWQWTAPGFPMSKFTAPSFHRSSRTTSHNEQLLIDFFVSSHHLILLKCTFESLYK